MAQSAWRETAEFQLGAFHPAPGCSPHRAPPPDRGEASKRVRLRGCLARTRVQPRNRSEHYGFLVVYPNGAADSLRAAMPILHFHGTDYQYAPFEGGHGAKSLTDTRHMPVMETIEIWRRANQTVPSSMIEAFPARDVDGTRNEPATDLYGTYDVRA